MLRCFGHTNINIERESCFTLYKKKDSRYIPTRVFVFQIPSLFGEDSFFGSKLQILSLVTQVLVFLGKGYLEDLV